MNSDYAMRVLAVLRKPCNDPTLTNLLDLIKMIHDRDLIHVDEVPEWLAAQDRKEASAERQRAEKHIAAAGMGGNGFAGAEYAAHVLTVAMRNGGA